MKLQLIIEDTPQGVVLRMNQGMNGCCDHVTDSLAAMWMTKFYTDMELAHSKGHAYIRDTTEYGLH